MDIATILADVQVVIAVGKLAIEVGQDAAPYLMNAYEIAFNNKVLTDQERADMRTQEAAFRAQIDTAIASDGA